jgi:hypothetical protein
MVMACGQVSRVLITSAAKLLILHGLAFAKALNELPFVSVIRISPNFYDTISKCALKVSLYNSLTCNATGYGEVSIRSISALRATVLLFVAIAVSGKCFVVFGGVVSTDIKSCSTLEVRGYPEEYIVMATLVARPTQLPRYKMYTIA